MVAYELAYLLVDYRESGGRQEIDRALRACCRDCQQGCDEREVQWAWTAWSADTVLLRRVLEARLTFKMPRWKNYEIAMSLACRWFR